MPRGTHLVDCHHCGQQIICGDCITYVCQSCEAKGHKGFAIDCPACKNETIAALRDALRSQAEESAEKIRQLERQIQRERWKRHGHRRLM
jgi:predicted metal-dependent RNase